MYIKRIRASNILSYDNIDIELNKLNVIIGPNASGKTNFIHILEFLRDIVLNGLNEAIENQGGIKYFTNINLGTSKECELEFEFECGGEEPGVIFSDNKISLYAVKVCDFKYSLKLEFESKSVNSWFVFNEKINALVEISSFEGINNLSEIDNIDDIKGKRLHDKEKIKLFFTNNKGQFQYNYESNEDLPEMYETFLKFPFSTRVLKDQNSNRKKSILERDILHPFFIPIKDFLEKISIYKINPQNLLQQSRKIQLEPDGSNLASVLEHILNDSKKRKEFLLIIKDLLPFIDTFQVKKRQKKILDFRFREIYLKSKDLLPSSLMSSGTIDLAIYTIIFYFEKKPFIIIEEPATNIHPQLISKFIEMVKDSSMNYGKQIIITSHNPEIIKYAGIENLIAINRNEDGYSEIYRPSSKEEIQIFLKNKLGIDELFIENLI